MIQPGLHSCLKRCDEASQSQYVSSLVLCDVAWRCDSCASLASSSDLFKRRHSGIAPDSSCVSVAVILVPLPFSAALRG